MKLLVSWLPAALMATGIVFTGQLAEQRSLPLRAPLGASIPMELAGYRAQDVQLSQAEVAAAGVSTYLLRRYSPTSGGPSAQVYVGYYERQLRGKTIHSPKNCLPGAGWEALAVRQRQIALDGRSIEVNQYLIQRKQQRALVLYWYQGRGRVVANEYTVKANLLRDAAFRRRSDEALVRIVVPITRSEDQAAATAASIARVIVPRLETALPASSI
jgi:EpsI family protein